MTNVLKSLADPTRRAMYERIAGTDAEVTAGALLKRARISQPAVSQHLRDLRQAGLILERRDGRHVHYRANPKGLAPLFDWLNHYAAFWPERLKDLENLLEEMP